MRKSVCICLLFLIPFISQAQKIKTVSGEYIYYPPETESYEESKKTAVQRAQLQILADTFGTMVDSGSATRISNVNGQSDIEQFTLGESHVKGEWIETIGEPTVTRYLTDDDMLAIKVKITGKVREIVKSKIDFKALALKNGTDVRFESTDFREGDELFLYFASPVDGFLTVYLYDGNNDVYRLLPYSQESDGSATVKAGAEYVFFSCEKADPKEAWCVDEYVLTCTRDIELNRIYTIFSPNTFTKALDSDSNLELTPRGLEYVDFQKWLSRVRSFDKDLEVKTIDITIKR